MNIQLQQKFVRIENTENEARENSEVYIWIQQLLGQL